MNTENNNQNSNSKIKSLVASLDNDMYGQVGSTVDSKVEMDKNLVKNLDDMVANDSHNDTNDINDQNINFNAKSDFLNSTDIVDNYNRINPNIIDDDSNFVSVEEQLTNSKDIDLYTQQPKTSPQLEEEQKQFNMNDLLANQNSGYNLSYGTNDVISYRIKHDRTTAFGNNNYIPKSSFASKPNVTETNFDKKMKKELKPFNFILYFIYLIAIVVIVYVGYKFLFSNNEFYLGKTELNIALGSSYNNKIYKKGVLEQSTDYEWISKNPKIASVNNEGKITALSEGTTTIEVTNKKSKRTNIVTVKVINLVIESFSIDTNDRVLYMGNTFTITPIINKQSNIVIDLDWISSDNSIATVNEYGIVTPIKPGKVQITVRIPNTEFSSTVDITVAQN